MNLMKLFNINYLMQNIKKSRNVILIFSIIVPLFTLLTLVVLGNDSSSIIDDGEIEIVNLLGMYAIPVIISMTLFGYVFKKNSVDFINSMPISRKSIFVTNTIGGIVIIFLIQLLTLILAFLASIIFDKLIFFSEMYLDIFFIMLVSYIFVFVAANLAMTISGNYLTQIAVTMLILFLVPFCIDTMDGFSYKKDMSLEGSDYTFRVDKIEGYSFSKPYQTISNYIKYNNYSIFDVKSMCHMFILSISYIGIGIFLFEKRKMEHTEESFSNVFVHIFVKSLTLIPFVVFLNMIEPSTEFLIFGLALIGVYYFVYDIVTKRKVKFLLSVISFAISIAIIMSVNKFIKYNKIIYNLKASDISEISIRTDKTFYNGLDSEIYLADRDIISLIYNNIENNVEDYYSTNMHGDYKIVQCYLKLSTSETVGVKLKMDIKKYEKLIAMLDNNNEYNNKLKKMLRINKSTKLLWQTSEIDDDTTNIIKREITKFLEDGNFDKFSNINYGDEYIEMLSYDNHNIRRVRVPITLTEDMFTAVSRFSNMNAKKIIEEREKSKYRYSNYRIDGYDNYSYDMYDRALSYAYEEIEEFIKETQNDICDMKLKYYTISSYGPNERAVFFTNKTDVIDEIIENIIKKYDIKPYEYNYIDTELVYPEVEYVD